MGTEPDWHPGHLAPVVALFPAHRRLRSLTPQGCPQWVCSKCQLVRGSGARHGNFWIIKETVHGLGITGYVLLKS